MTFFSLYNTTPLVGGWGSVEFIKKKKSKTKKKTRKKFQDSSILSRTVNQHAEHPNRKDTRLDSLHAGSSRVMKT